MAQKDLPPPSDDDPSTQQFDDTAGSSAVAIAETDASEGGKLKMIVQLVKRCLGVKDIAAMCVLRCSTIQEISGMTDDAAARSGDCRSRPVYWSPCPI